MQPRKVQIIPCIIRTSKEIRATDATFMSITSRIENEILNKSKPAWRNDKYVLDQFISYHSSVKNDKTTKKIKREKEPAAP